MRNNAPASLLFPISICKQEHGHVRVAARHYQPADKCHHSVLSTSQEFLHPLRKKFLHPLKEKRNLSKNLLKQVEQWQWQQHPLVELQLHLFFSSAY
jgi:hypothetical protein